MYKNLVTLQNQLDEANNTINRQKQRIEQKNQQLTDLSEQLTGKDKLIDELQIQVNNLKFPPIFEDDKDQKIGKLQGQLEEKDKIIEQLKNKPLSSLDEKKNNLKKISTSITPSTEKLLKIIEEQKQEIQSLKKLIAEASSATEITQETPIEKTIQRLPKKNVSALWLCLLGYSLGTIVLCLNLLKKIKKEKDKKQNNN